jgi:hypothetical protein
VFPLLGAVFLTSTGWDHTADQKTVADALAIGHGTHYRPMAKPALCGTAHSVEPEKYYLQLTTLKLKAIGGSDELLVSGQTFGPIAPPFREKDTAYSPVAPFARQNIRMSDLTPG